MHHKNQTLNSNNEIRITGDNLGAEKSESWKVPTFDKSICMKISFSRYMLEVNSQILCYQLLH